MSDLEPRKDICSKCKCYMGTWRRGEAEGIRCYLSNLKGKDLKDDKAWKRSVPVECPLLLEQTVSQDA